MRLSIRQIFLLVLLLFCLLLSSGCAAVSQEMQFMLENTQDRAAQRDGIHTVRLGRWTDDVPDGTLLQIDVLDDYQVYLTSGDDRQPLGKLTQQFPDTPITSMFIDTGKDRFVVGWIDESVQGHLSDFTLGRYVADSEHRPVNNSSKAWGIDGGSRMFFSPIFRYGPYRDEIQKWERISYIRVDTRESLRAFMNGEESPLELHRDYDPPIDIVPLLQHVTVP